VSRHVAEAFAAPVWGVFGLLDAANILRYCSFPKHIEASEDALVGEVETTVAVATVLLDDLVLGTLLGDVPLFMAIVAEAVATSAS